MKTHRKTLRLGPLAAILLALAALLLAACGEDEPDEPTRQVNTLAPALDAPNDAPADDAALNVGDPAPEFTLPTANGGTVSLTDYTGEQPVLLYFHMAAG